MWRITAVKKLEETALRAIDNRKGYGDYLIVLVYRVSYLSLTVMWYVNDNSVYNGSYVYIEINVNDRFLKKKRIENYNNCSNVTSSSCRTCV